MYRYSLLETKGFADTEILSKKTNCWRKSVEEEVSLEGNQQMMILVNILLQTGLLDVSRFL